ncbi:unnamed protein product [Heligmosomoides polygyrus]|uniref:Endo/exonuclease/phosphatase domain-containing protein n=1 Tax=Heligmosomoides polygyrus TaxID=6339 RepID=A0A183GDY5_HELPZ|nr:unnamed protein product [Heligmosomoides polygyrus]
MHLTSHIVIPKANLVFMMMASLTVSLLLAFLGIKAFALSFDCVFVAYAPTSYDDEEVEAFYEELEKFYKEDHTLYKVIVGDFNAKIGPRRSPEELHIGAHGLEWNEQGERLSEFLMSTKTIHGNSQFQKPPSLRWTWESLGGQFYNEIDHIIFNRKYCLTDVSVVPGCGTLCTNGRRGRGDSRGERGRRRRNWVTLAANGI